MTANIIRLLGAYGLKFLGGLRVTLMLSALTIVASLPLGGLICMLRMSRLRAVRLLASSYIEVVRGLPLLLQLYCFVFLLPRALPLQLTRLQNVSLSLALFSAAYVAELFRSGIQAVDSGQMEAARSLGLSKAQAMMAVVLPQAVRNILPGLGNQFVIIIKDTSLASVFFVDDLMTVQKVLTGTLYTTMEPMIIAGVIYFALTFSLSKLVSLYEKRVSLA
ncbi:MAG: amino acid ABC transporter permease [Clostridiales bacterium]|nr:amino acid ABC transporter permease [Clostridiales bacterium]